MRRFASEPDAVAAAALKVVGVTIRLDQLELAFFAALRLAVLHADDASEPLFVDVVEDVVVVDLPGVGLFSSGVVANLEVGNFRPGFVDVWDQIAFGDLLMVEIIENFAVRAAHSAADRKALRNFG